MLAHKATLKEKCGWKNMQMQRSRKDVNVTVNVIVIEIRDKCICVSLRGIYYIMRILST
jgi:hypothetical protein